MSNRAERPPPLKAVLPVSSLLRGYQCPPSASYFSASALSPPLRHISPEHLITASGHRSPGAINYKASGKSMTRSLEPCIRRTASLDTLTCPRPVWSTIQAHSSCMLHVDKATQTEESYCMEMSGRSSTDILRSDTPTEGVKIEKVIRQRLQQRSHSQRSTEHSVSSQTQSTLGATLRASPVTIPARTGPHGHLRPMRSSVEGLNQEIEKLVLIPGQQHTCRPESNRNLFSRGTPDGHRAPIAELLHGDTRSVNTQTPLGDVFLSSDDSQSTSPDESGSNAAGYRATKGTITSASPRINKFLAREPPDGCEKVNLRPTESSEQTTIFKPCFVGGLRPSLGSAFQPLQPLSPSTEEPPTTPPKELYNLYNLHCILQIRP
ncbi:protein FAM117B-like isoform X3 [Phlebotomus papatasi]|uniref:protein FAM117B-like isoform X3 n=1 Tax=Phlebotomus papatasi TaxID=29031 RepID=UPI002483A0F3|nr:protein FAM117B-like isoform X3 [Phlebotomus papatasi]